MSDNSIGIMLTVCSHYPEIYNKVSNLLYKNFQLRGAEQCLLCSYVVIMMSKNYPELFEEVTHEESTT